jgi:hypothetical protein
MEMEGGIEGGTGGDCVMKKGRIDRQRTRRRN